MSDRPKTVKELQEVLSMMPTNAPITGTWQGTFNDVSVYQAKDGGVVIDLDQEFYRAEIESGQIKPEY